MASSHYWDLALPSADSLGFSLVYWPDNLTGSHVCLDLGLQAVGYHTREDEMGRSKARWVKKGEWSSVEITRARTGFLVRFLSQIQGERNGRWMLLPYSDSRPKGLDLDAPWNDLHSNGDRVWILARDYGVVIRHGDVVR